ncbi:MAG: adenosylcobinamide-phosphate synthase CbiB [Burkholderiaceae bacterium]|nr:adenosylcobinamide-phosphate synthase CbiB [Burkholderiaceae bacterium]
MNSLAHAPSWPLGLVAALWLALLVDRWLGEPPVRWHPVVWMGQYLGWVGQRLAPQRSQPGAADYRRFWLGALAWWVGAALVLIVSLALQWLVLAWHPVAGALLLGLLLKPLLAWRMLRDEVQAVEAALQTSLESGRAQLARLVSRDVSALDEHQVRESAIESLAENLNDSVVAPLFWFVLLGLPGAALYRYANTADAMWGYRGLRSGRDWTWAGKWAARADDVLSWLPARLTALLLALVRGGLPWRALWAQAPRTPSPNSGWPMAAMALALDVRLGKPGVYVLHEAGRVPQTADTARAVRLGERAVLLWAVLLAAALFFVGENRA